jgi:hypothetical protein
MLPRPVEPELITVGVDEVVVVDGGLLLGG